MGKYLRIANRGNCPRILLAILGATTKRERFSDPSQGGWFGSGTTFAPIAALRLGIRVFFTSNDEKGPYLITYDTRKERDGDVVIDRVVWKYADGSIEPTPYSSGAAMNWDRPIEADGMKAFRVLREYLRNARDADPKAPDLAFVDKVKQAPEGWTFVFLEADDEFRHMLHQAHRYFKYLGPTPYVFRKEGLGAIHVKSDSEKTRLFSLGTLAACSTHSNLTTVYDYDLYDKRNLNEERTFVSMAQVHHDIAKLLGYLDDSDIARRILRHAIDGTAMLERQALGNLGSSVLRADPNPDLSVWIDAWKSLYGDTAVISSTAYADEYVRHKGILCVDVSDMRLKAFLKACGVASSADGVTKTSDYVIVEPNDRQRHNLDFAMRILREEGLLAQDSETHVVSAKPYKKDPDQGFCLYGHTPIGIYILDRVCDDYETCLTTLYHEHRHGRKRADDQSRRFTQAADDDMAKQLIEKHGSPNRRATDHEFTDADIEALFADADDLPDASLADNSVTLIRRCILKVKALPPKSSE